MLTICGVYTLFGRLPDKNPGVEIAKCLAFIFILHDFQDTIYTLIMHKMKLYEEQRENDIKKIRGNLSSIEQYINNCSDPEVSVRNLRL